MAWIAMIMQGASAATSAFGTWQQGNIANQTATLNADTMGSRANEIEAEARVRADIQGHMNARALGHLSSAYAAAGISLDESGTYMDVLSDAAAEGELQRQLILYGGRSAANALRYQAELERYQGAQAKEASEIAAATTLLTGFGQAAATGYKGGLFSSSKGTGGGTTPTSQGSGYTVPSGVQM